MNRCGRKDFFKDIMKSLDLEQLIQSCRAKSNRDEKVSI